MNIYEVVHEPCEICLKEYIHDEVAKLANMPDDQTKASNIQRIMEKAQKEVKSISVLFPCFKSFTDGEQHKFCLKHLYEMIDAIKEYEENGNDASMS